MSDQDSSVRVLATHSFANLIQLMPLDGSNDRNSAHLTPKLADLKETQRHFLEQLFNPTSIPDYKLPIPIRAEIRSYQQVFNLLVFKIMKLICLMVLSKPLNFSYVKKN
jgi:TATA-binding protein-associated factor